MRKTTAMLAAAAACAMTISVSIPAGANGQPGDYSIALDALNDSGASGSAVLTLHENGDLDVSVEADGLAPGAPHAQHIHGDTDLSQDFTCPGPDADENGDGFVDVAEGVPSYGNIHISLTTEGDTSPDSGLAVDRMPVADDDGSISYSRTIPAEDLPDGTAEAIRNLHVVLHGVDINENGEYDFDANGPSELNDEVPFEATVPAACGIISGANVEEMPDGGVDTGAGALASSAGGAAPLVLPASILAALTAVGLAVAGIRRRRSVTPSA